MKQALTVILILLFLNARSQKVQVVILGGVHYSGLSYISKGDLHPDDFLPSVPELNGTLGFDIKYKKRNISHVVGFQVVTLGSSYGVNNMFADKGILPYFVTHKHSDGIDNFLINYNLEIESKKTIHLSKRMKAKLFYSAGGGIGTNKSESYYREYMTPLTYSSRYDDLYYADKISFKRAGVGVFLNFKAGVSLYNRKKKEFLRFHGFYAQGLKKMEDFTVDYEYGYTSYPQYQRNIKGIHLKSRGSVFGLLIGIPIRIINGE
jgi:hypothetical protein